MSLYILYGFIMGIAVVLLAVYGCVICNLYSYYRKHGMTRKQAILSVWRMQNE
jgi:hypothetical protein